MQSAAVPDLTRKRERPSSDPATIVLDHEYIDCDDAYRVDTYAVPWSILPEEVCEEVRKNSHLALVERDHVPKLAMFLLGNEVEEDEHEDGEVKATAPAVIGLQHPEVVCIHCTLGKRVVNNKTLEGPVLVMRLRESD